MPNRLFLELLNENLTPLELALLVVSLREILQIEPLSEIQFVESLRVGRVGRVALFDPSQKKSYFFPGFSKKACRAQLA